MKKISIIILFIASILFFSPKEVIAETTLRTSNYSINLLANENSEKVCTGLLGKNLKKDLEQVLKIIRIVGPLIVVFLTSIELIGAIVNKDDDALKKVLNKLMTRLALVAVLFFLPIILDILLSFLDEKYTSCLK